MRIFLFLSLFLFSGCTTTHPLSSDNPEKTIIKMLNAIDKKDWQTALNQFDDIVFTDYSSMTGQAGENIKAKDLVAGWEKLLTKAKTHHIVSNFETSSNKKSAEVFSHVYASHTAKNINYWDIYGRYQHKLKKTSKGWKITFMKLIVHGQRGNSNFLNQLAKQK